MSKTYFTGGFSSELGLTLLRHTIPHDKLCPPVISVHIYAGISTTYILAKSKKFGTANHSLPLILFKTEVHIKLFKTIHITLEQNTLSSIDYDI